MEKPDANGFVNVNWPSTNVPHGGIFHTRIVEPSTAQQEFIKVLLEESKLSITQRQKGALRLREENERTAEQRQPRQPQVRPHTSRRRSLSAIRASGIFDSDLYRPLKRGEDRERMIEKLANTMAYGDTQEQKAPPSPKVTKPTPKLPSSKEKWNELLTQIRERAEWLAEMEYLGQAGPHREIVHDQIAERMRALDALGVDSECSSDRSHVSGFSTTRSRENVQSNRSRSSAKSQEGSVKSKPKEKKKAIRSLAHRANKEENITAYGQLSPLQYSPRRRV